MSAELIKAKAALAVAYSGALYRLRSGHAASYDISNLVRVLRVSEELCATGVGEDHHGVCDEARGALMAVDARHLMLGMYKTTDADMAAILRLLELMDAQVEVATGTQLADAITKSFEGKHES